MENNKMPNEESAETGERRQWMAAFPSLSWENGKCKQPVLTHGVNKNIIQVQSATRSAAACSRWAEEALAVV